MLTKKGVDIMPAMYVRDPETGRFVPVGGGGGSAIDDTTPSTVTVYSGKKTQDEIDRLDEQINEQKEAIDEKLDSLNEEIAALKSSGTGGSLSVDENGDATISGSTFAVDENGNAVI